MKNCVCLLSVIVLFSCTNKKKPEIKAENGAVVQDSVKAPEKPDNPGNINTIFLLVPGVSAGIISIGENADSLSVLGKPDLSDAAMGKAWMTWQGQHGTAKEEMNIYTTYKDDGMKEKTVRLVRVASAEYRTAGNLGSGNSLAQIREGFVDLKLLARYKHRESKNEVTIYDSVAGGIAFEIEKSSCIAVIIHQKGKKVTDEYITLHPDMVKL